MAEREKDANYKAIANKIAKIINKSPIERVCVGANHWDKGACYCFRMGFRSDSKYVFVTLYNDEIAIDYDTWRWQHDYECLWRCSLADPNCFEKLKKQIENKTWS